MTDPTLDDKTVSTRGQRGLIVVDMTCERTEDAGGTLNKTAAQMMPFLSGELRYFRERGRPVFFVVPQGETIIRELTPRRDEPVIERRAFSAFFETELSSAFQKTECGRVTIVGWGAASSVLLTAAGAMARGLGVTVPEPCIADRREEDKSAALHLLFNVWGAPAEASGEHDVSR